MAFSKVRARLGAARLVLAEVDSQQALTVHSKFQSRAVEQMLVESSLNLQEKADLATMISTVKFASADENRLLSILSTDVDSIVDSTKRRPQQAFYAFPAYLNLDDWEYIIEVGSCEAVVEKLVEILVTRFYCINPCNFTTKRIACLAMAIDKKNRTEATMNAILTGARHQ